MLESLPINDFGFSITTIAKLIFLSILGAYAIFSAVLYFHWTAYSSDLKITALTLLVYFCITIPLLISLSTLAVII